MASLAPASDAEGPEVDDPHYTGSVEAEEEEEEEEEERPGKRRHIPSVPEVSIKREAVKGALRTYSRASPSKVASSSKPRRRSPSPDAIVIESDVSEVLGKRRRRFRDRDVDDVFSSKPSRRAEPEIIDSPAGPSSVVPLRPVRGELEAEPISAENWRDVFGLMKGPSDALFVRLLFLLFLLRSANHLLFSRCPPVRSARRAAPKSSASSWATVSGARPVTAGSRAARGPTSRPPGLVRTSGSSPPAKGPPSVSPFSSFLKLLGLRLRRRSPGAHRRHRVQLEDPLGPPQRRPRPIPRLVEEEADPLVCLMAAGGKLRLRLRRHSNLPLEDAARDLRPDSDRRPRSRSRRSHGLLLPPLLHGVVRPPPRQVRRRHRREATVSRRRTRYAPPSLRMGRFAIRPRRRRRCPCHGRRLRRRGRQGLRRATTAFFRQRERENTRLAREGESARSAVTPFHIRVSLFLLLPSSQIY